ncbi:hypothetical protein LRR72_22145 [Klebsiella pneumoniae]|uniref:hypothetical protein n=1 Tax=Klebsiella pneumoniae TaxID=573 RepID=UPI002244C0BC|nr:hypothetical protein [Klebsiella pneumoniae]MCW8291305.1 hypothetical protein [Klebsiella pneumoniae]MDK1955928.1 hypothetical protein [Klebsiella pneumoniae]
MMDAIHKKRKATYQVTFFSRFHIASVVVLMGDTSCQRASIARSLEAQDAKFSDDFMEQFHDDFLTQVQFITLFFVIYIT